MRPFTFMHDARPWPDALTLLHVYVVADLARDRDLAALVAGCRAATSGEPLAHVGDRWLHVTLCQLTTPSGEIAGPRRAALAAAIGRRLSDIEPFAVTVGDPFCVPTGVLFAITDGEDRLAGIRDRVSEAARSLVSLGTVRGDSGMLHLTESYACGEADDDRVRRQLSGVRPRRATLRVDAVELVDVSADQQAKTITWKRAARIPLGTRAAG